MEDIINDFEEYLQNKKRLKSNTVIGYRNDVSGFLKYINCPVSKITHKNAISYLKHLEKQRRAHSGIARTAASLKAFNSFLADSIGGSQIYAKEGELLSAEDVLKSIIIVSGNDAAVIMAEHLGGTYENFISMMNKRAAELGMNDTLFASANGLEDDITKQYSTARDVAIMSCELMKHEDIKKYTLIWMDSIRDGKFRKNDKC